MSNRDPLKTRLAFRILPGNIQHIGFDFACDDFQAGQQIGAGIGNFSVHPGLMRQDHILFGPNGADCFEPNVSLRRATARRFQVFQEDCQNLYAFERNVGVVAQLQANSSFVINETKGQGFSVLALILISFSRLGLAARFFKPFDAFVPFALWQQRQHVARLTLERLTHLLQRFEVDAQRLALLKTPKRRVADAGLLRQPIEGSPVLRQ